MLPGPWAMSLMRQKLHPSAPPGANSVITPAGVMRAILAGADVNSVPSVNQRLPSEPFVMARGWLSAVGTLNCFSAAIGAASASLPSDKTGPTASIAATTPSRHARFIELSLSSQVASWTLGGPYAAAPVAVRAHQPRLGQRHSTAWTWAA